MFHKLTKYILLALICSQSVAFSWWDKGHMVVAKIAEERLEEGVREQVEQLIDVIGEGCPDSATFVEAACWLDDIMNRGVLMVKTWHGHAGPYNIDGFLSEEEEARVFLKYNGNDGVAAIERSIETLSKKKAGRWEKAFMLRVLLHVVGDLHCPMHCIQQYSEAFPEGDKGGVRFNLAGPSELALKHLHGLWDSMVLLDNTGRDIRSLNAEALQSVKELADMITTMYPDYSLPEKGNRCVEDWAQESYNAGLEAYNGIEPNTVPSAAYIEKSRPVACKRLALAGYRLADILNECFADDNMR